MLKPEEILELTIETGYKKTKKSFLSKIILGFIGGAMISLGYLAYIRVISSIAHDFGSFASFIGACVFPIGLIVILLAGGELATGNMMAVFTAFLGKKIKFTDYIKNLLVITFSNFIGAVFVAYVFGHVVGLTSSGIYLEETIAIASAKINATFIQALLSGIGCNWFVGLSLWLCYGSTTDSGKILSTWFPVMTFVAIGFQHSIANIFVIFAAIFENQATILQFINNFIPVFIGNVLGGAIFVGALYFYSYKKH